MSVFNAAVNELTTGGHPAFQPYEPSDVDQLDVDYALQVFTHAFSDPEVRCCWPADFEAGQSG